MATNEHDIHPWIAKSIQGIPFWVGYQRARDSNPKLREPVLVDELRKLLLCNRPDGTTVHLEYPFRKINPRYFSGVERRKVDLVIKEPYATRAGKASKRTTLIFEVKLATATERAIDIDLRRLSTLKQARPDCRTFLLIASERKIPERFVNLTGKISSQQHPIPDDSGSYAAIRLYKAAPAFDKRDAANYACLIEVFAS